MHVYCITNTVNGKIYIGQHCKDNLQSYLRHNLSASKRGKTNKPWLYAAIRKYGEQQFVIKSLVKLPPVLSIDEARDQLNRLEVFFIKTLDSQHSKIGYNANGGGGGQLGIPKNFSEEQKAHMSRIMKARPVTWAKQISLGLTGKKHSEATKQKMRAARLGKSKYPRTEEHKRKVSEKVKAKWASLTEEQRKERGRKSSEALTTWWKDQPVERKAENSNRLLAGLRKKSVA